MINSIFKVYIFGNNIILKYNHDIHEIVIWFVHGSCRKKYQHLTAIIQKKEYI